MKINHSNKPGICTCDFFFIGFGAIVGVGWAVSINKWMGNCGGPLPSAIGYLIALIFLVPVGLVYCELVPMLPVAGGGIAYSYKAFGEKVSFLCGWATFGAFVTIIPWEAIYIVDILCIICPVLKSGNPLYTLAGSEIYVGHIMLGFVFSTIIFLLNWRGMEYSVIAQRYMCILLITIGFLAMISAAIKFDITNLRPFYNYTGSGRHSTFFGGALAILASAPFYLAGFETIPQAVEDAGAPVKNVGFAVLMAICLACLFYSSLLFAFGGAYPWLVFLNNVSSPAAANLFKIIYSAPYNFIMFYVTLIGSILGLLTTWNGFMIGSPRLLMAMGRANMISKWFSKQHPKYGTPSNALIVCYLISCIGPFLGMGLIDPLTSFSAAGFVLSWIIASFSLIRLRKKAPDLFRPYKIPGGISMALFAGISMVFIFMMLFIPVAPPYIGSLAIILFIVWMGIGCVLYFLASAERNSISVEARAIALFVMDKSK